MLTALAILLILASFIIGYGSYFLINVQLRDTSKISSKLSYLEENILILQNDIDTREENLLRYKLNVNDRFKNLENLLQNRDKK